MHALGSMYCLETDVQLAIGGQYTAYWFLSDQGQKFNGLENLFRCGYSKHIWIPGKLNIVHVNTTVTWFATYYPKGPSLDKNNSNNSMTWMKIKYECFAVYAREDLAVKRFAPDTWGWIWYCSPILLTRHIHVPALFAIKTERISTLKDKNKVVETHQAIIYLLMNSCKCKIFVNQKSC